MNITFVLPTANMSGGTRVVAIYADKLKQYGHSVTLISVPKRPLSFRRKLKSLLNGNGWPKVDVQPSYIDDMNIQHKVLEKFRPVVDSDVPDGDIVIATWWLTAEWVANLSESKGAKVYFIQHHETHNFLPVDRCKATYLLPMHKIVIAKWLKHLMQDDYGDANVDLVANSVDHNQFNAPERFKQPIPTVGFLYSHSSYKGVDITLSAIEKIRSIYPNLRVISFGSVLPNESNVLDESIEFHYSPEQASIKNLYAQCDVWLTASKTEGFNLPAMEAMACRCPVVSTKAGWPEESISTGYNGALVEVDDIDSLANETIKILSMKNTEWQEMSANAFNTVSESTWDKSARLFEGALRHACERSNNGEIMGKCRC